MESSATVPSRRVFLEQKKAAWKAARHAIFPALALTLERHCPNKWVQINALLEGNGLAEGMTLRIFLNGIFKNAIPDLEEKGTRLYSFADNRCVLLRHEFQGSYYVWGCTKRTSYNSIKPREAIRKMKIYGWRSILAS
jgi:hypothetical protein